MIGERQLLEIIERTVARRDGVVLGIGDDAAVIDGADPMVATHDMLVEGVHFRRTTASLGDVGHKALAVNLSDVAAMGARPVAALVGLGLPDDVAPADVAEMYAAMEALAAEHDVTIAGGDLTRAPVVTVGVTALGRCDGRPPLRRDGGRPGDVLYVSGPLGAAAAGLVVLEGGAAGVDAALAAGLQTAQRRPRPQVREGAALAAAGVHALMDCSDGLALDVQRLAIASGLHATIDLGAVPRAPGVDPVARALGVDADVFAATGGEDYVLIAAAAPEDRVGADGRLGGVPVVPVGRLDPGTPGVRLLRAGTPVTAAQLGWEH